MRWLVFLACLAGLQASAQVVQNFELTNVVDGNTISLKNYSSNPAVVIIVTTINCPYSEYYLSRIKTLAESFRSKVPVMLINASVEGNESEVEMAAYAKKNNFTFPYLADKEGKAFSTLNPRKSPEAFVLQNSSGNFRVVYRGAIDDNPQSATDVNHAFLQEAINALLAGQKVEAADVRPVGCSVKKN